MRFIAIMIAVVGAILTILTSSSASVDATTVYNPATEPLPQALTDVPLLVSAFSVDQDVNFIELYNQTDKPIRTGGWSVRILSTENQEFVVNLPDAYLAAESYLAIGDPNYVTGSDVEINQLILDGDLYSITIVNSDTEAVNSVMIGDYSQTTLGSKWLQRKSATSGLNGVMADFTAKDYPASVRGHGVFPIPPLSAMGVQINEIYPNHSSCGPTDESILCGDYIKLYNPGDSPIDLSPYRLRTDSGSSIDGNSFSLEGLIIESHNYLLVRFRDDGVRLSLTNDGGFVWIEDLAGTMIYDETIVEYPDASSTTKVGWSWSFDASDNQWYWTNTPSPLSANVFPVEIPVVLGSANEPVQCPEGKYRNPITNRCNNIEVESTLKPCAENQVRNPLTNRCRSLIVSEFDLKPCLAGQERNPATNRCRNIVDSTEAPVPCRSGYERNPETNRCRKIISAGGTPAKQFATADSGRISIGVPVLVSVGILAGGYAVYEWRDEIAKLIGRIRAKMGK